MKWFESITRGGFLNLWELEQYHLKLVIFLLSRDSDLLIMSGKMGRRVPNMRLPLSLVLHTYDWKILNNLSDEKVLFLHVFLHA